jgi:hypothetical protein
VRAGELADVYELPGAVDAITELGELDELDGEPSGASAGSDDPPWVSTHTRERFDRREVATDRAADGTVSSATWRAPTPTSPPAVWRPPSDVATPATPLRMRAVTLTDRDPTLEPGARFVESRKGGIQFAAPDDDDDLAAYMNPDDVLPVSDEDD